MRKLVLIIFIIIVCLSFSFTWQAEAKNEFFIFKDLEVFWKEAQTLGFKVVHAVNYHLGDSQKTRLEHEKRIGDYSIYTIAKFVDGKLIEIDFVISNRISLKEVYPILNISYSLIKCNSDKTDAFVFLSAIANCLDEENKTKKFVWRSVEAKAARFIPGDQTLITMRNRFFAHLL